MTADHASQAEQMARSARQAARTVSVADTRQKNEALAAIASALGQEAEAIKAANARDLEAGRRAGLSAAMMRLVRASASAALRWALAPRKATPHRAVRSPRRSWCFRDERRDGMRCDMPER